MHITNIIGYYFDGQYKKEVFAVRPAALRYYHPMCWDLQRLILDKIVQVKIDYLGSLMWINIWKTELRMIK